MREISYLDSPYREALAGFMARQPRFYSGLDGSGAVEMRDFSGMRDLHLSYAILDQIDSAAELFRAMFAIDIASPNFRAQMAAREIRLSQLVLTGLARLALDNRLAIDPIEGSRLTAMRAAIMSGQPGTLNDEFRARVHRALAERLDDAARRRTADFLNSCLNLLEKSSPTWAANARSIRALSKACWCARAQVSARFRRVNFKRDGAVRAGAIQRQRHRGAALELRGLPASRRAP